LSPAAGTSLVPRAPVRAFPPSESAAAIAYGVSADHAAAGDYRGCMVSRPVRPPVSLFDNPVRVFSLDELAQTVRALERARPGLTVEKLANSAITAYNETHPDRPY
jgi:hypothetical protein